MLYKDISESLGTIKEKLASLDKTAIDICNKHDIIFNHLLVTQTRKATKKTIFMNTGSFFAGIILGYYLFII